MPTLPGSSATPEASPYARHIPALDGVRGLAILGVMGSHFFRGTPSSTITWVIQQMIIYGAAGVDLFFALSGFLITGILFDSLGDKQFFRKFYARRALRIFPLYYGVILACAIAGMVLHRGFDHELLSLSLYLQNTNLIATPIYQYPDLPLSHFWSLAIEEQFYLGWPVLVFALHKRSRLLGLAAVSLIVCPVLRVLFGMYGMSAVTIHVSTLLRADALLAGAALALLLRGKEHDRALRLIPWLLIPAVGFHIATFIPSQTSSLFKDSLAASLAQTGYPLGGIALIALSLRNGLAKRFFELAPMRAMGKYSYGLYVLHLILFDFLHERMHDFFALHVTHSKGALVILVALAGFALSFAGAYLSYQLYEKPFLRLKKYFDYRPNPNTVT